MNHYGLYRTIKPQTSGSNSSITASATKNLYEVEDFSPPDGCPDLYEFEPLIQTASTDTADASDIERNASLGDVAEW